MTLAHNTHVSTMFSSRLLLFFAFVALAAAYPADDEFSFPRPITTITETDVEDGSPWFKFPLFGNFFAPLTKLFSSFADIGPKIEVDDKQFKVVINCKEYKKSDLKVKVKGDFVLVQGSHEAKHDDHDLYASQFLQTYSLPYNASASTVTALLTSDGYLVVTAPIDYAQAEAEKDKVIEREVPIVESGAPLENKEDKVNNEEKPEDIPVRASDDVPVEVAEPKVTTEASTTVADEDDKREPTTASDREEVTVRDIPNEVNEISSANEVQP